VNAVSEKTEEPTDKKLEDARKKGESPKSPDATAAFSMLGLTLMLTGMGASLFNAQSSIVKKALQVGATDVDNEILLVLVADLIKDAMLALVPIVCASMVLAVVGLFAQIGFNLNFEAITPKFEKLNPAEGLKKLISVKSLIEVGKSILKAFAFGVVIWQVVQGLVPLMVGAAYLSPFGVGVVAWSGLLKLLSAACLVYVIIGPADFVIQKVMFMRDQRMSKDDIKREYKDSDGDPHLKGHLSNLRREFASEDPPNRVPGATVVVTNPTHYAVALRYDPDTSPIPVIVAKGMDAQAAVIRALAVAHGVPMIGDPPLARALHKLPLDSAVPEELFEAVAAVMRWVEQVKAIGAQP
jgi:type III secretion protein U